MPGQSAKTEVVTIRLGSEDFQRLKRQADREGVPLASIIRRAVQVPVGSGAMVIRSISDNPTPEAVVGAYSQTGSAAHVIGALNEPNVRVNFSATASR